MNEAEKIEKLEAILARFLEPIKGIPFPIVIQSICKREVIRIDPENPQDQDLIGKLVGAALAVGQSVRETPIIRPRPNEVGNDLEPFVARAIVDVGLKSEKPTSASGRGQGVGYPDLLIFDAVGRPTYVEIKSYAEGSAHNTMRSFYLSPSSEPKVSLDARHIVLGFGVSAEAINGSRNSRYFATSFALIDIYGLECDVKYEFNSDNRRLYQDSLVLAKGEC